MKNLLTIAAIFVFMAPAIAQTRIPEFSARTMSGKSIDLAKLKGKVVVINLWFINCPNCVEEIKLLNKLVEDHKNNADVVFLGLASSRRPELEAFLKKNPFAYEIIPDATSIILSKFGTPDKHGDIYLPFPMHYVIDREGNTVVKVQGIAGVDAVRKELERQLTK